MGYWGLSGLLDWRKVLVKVDYLKEKLLFLNGECVFSVILGSTVDCLTLSAEIFYETA